MSVDLPAPFSPSSAWTSPRRRSKSTWSLATTPGKRFVMPRSSRTAGSCAIGGNPRGRERVPPPGLAVCLLLDRRVDLARLDLCGELVRALRVLPSDRRRQGLAQPAVSDAVVLQREDRVVATLELRLRLDVVLDRVVNRDVDLLRGTG